MDRDMAKDLIDAVAMISQYLADIVTLLTPAEPTDDSEEPTG